MGKQTCNRYWRQRIFRNIYNKKAKKRGCKNIALADLPEYNLVELQDIKRMYQEQKPDIVIHLAAVVGGIGANRENPIMGIQLLHEAYLSNIEKFVAIGTICAYPKFTPVPFKEEDLWNGYPEETNALLRQRSGQALWIGKEDDACSVPGISPTIWL